MRKVINGSVEILRKDFDSQGFPICDESGFIVGSGETYNHALEIKEAVSNYSQALELLNESKKELDPTIGKSKRIQQKINRFLSQHILLPQ